MWDWGGGGGVCWSVTRRAKGPSLQGSRSLPLIISGVVSALHSIRSSTLKAENSIVEGGAEACALLSRWGRCEHAVHAIYAAVNECREDVDTALHSVEQRNVLINPIDVATKRTCVWRGVWPGTRLETAVGINNNHTILCKETARRPCARTVLHPSSPTHPPNAHLSRRRAAPLPACRVSPCCVAWGHQSCCLPGRSPAGSPQRPHPAAPGPAPCSPAGEQLHSSPPAGERSRACALVWAWWAGLGRRASEEDNRLEERERMCVWGGRLRGG
jgi:hypothetical protein